MPGEVKLTDEQIEEGLERAAVEEGIDASTKLRACKESGAEYIRLTDPLVCCDPDNLTCGKCNGCLVQKLQAAEAERAAEDGAWHFANKDIDAVSARLLEVEAERDAAIADRDKNSQQVADEYAEAQCARREAFEEAAKLVMEGAKTFRDHPTQGDVETSRLLARCAAAIRALTEKPSGGAAEVRHLRQGPDTGEGVLHRMSAERGGDEVRRYCDVCWDTLPDAAFSAEERKYAHMCRDEHIEIGHNDSGDDERCPVCRERDRADSAEARVQRLEEALRGAIEWMDEEGCDCGMNEPCALCIALAALTTPGEEGKRCVRCGSPYRPDGGCADTPCQGGVGEWAPPEKPEPPKLPHAFVDCGLGDMVANLLNVPGHGDACHALGCGQPRSAHRPTEPTSP